MNAHQTFAPIREGRSLLDSHHISRAGASQLFTILFSLLGILLAVLTSSSVLAEPVANPLDAQEKQDGWRLLFDGKSLAGWHNFKQEGPPQAGWVVESGVLKKPSKVRGGDLLSDATFLDFDFRWEWRIQPRGNNGIKYFVREERSQPLGHEYQMIDDEVMKSAKHQTASFYDVLEVQPHHALKPPGEWNASRVLVQGDRVEHWLNGQLVLSYIAGSPAVMDAVAKSKFKDVAGFGRKQRGHLMLTDHNDQVEYRNLKIRELTAPSSR